MNNKKMGNQNFESYYLQTILDNIFNAIIITNVQGTIQRYNLFTLGMLKRTIIKESDQIQDFLFEQDGITPICIQQIDKQLNTNPSQTQQEGIIYRGDKSLLEVEFSIGNFLSPQSKERIFIIQDISKRKHHERQTNQLMQQLKQANQDMTDFVHIVSHDLKSPLRSITQHLEYLHMDAPSFLKKNLKEIVKETYQMEELIQSILRYSLADLKEEKPSKVNLNEVIKGIIKITNPPKHIEIKVVRSLPSLWTEKTKIHQIFQNLIINSIEASDKTNAQICIDYEEKINLNQYDNYEFFISDNGKGMSKIDSEKLFQPFSKGHQSNRGVGLSIVKKLVEKLGGQLRLKSEENKGSCFIFCIPKAFSLYTTSLHDNKNKI